MIYRSGLCFFLSRRFFSRRRAETTGVIEVPTLVIWGERDEALVPQNPDGLDRYGRNLTIERRPEATHWIVHEEPERVEGWIRDFLSAAGGPAGISLANPW